MSNLKNPNSFFMRLKKFFTTRWNSSDTPTSEPRFTPSLLMKDLALFVLLPVGSILIFKLIENAVNQRPGNRTNFSQMSKKDFKLDASKSQIIEFKRSGLNIRNTYGRRSPGTLIKVKLLNVVETFSNSPVHAQIIDISLGGEWIGATLIGEATGDSKTERVNIAFNLLKSETQLGLAVPLKARALSLNGTLGVEAEKKEGYFARAALRPADSINQNSTASENENDLKTFLIRALASGLLQEASSTAQIASNNSQTLILKPGEVFFVELTDYFPGDRK